MHIAKQIKQNKEPNQTPKRLISRYSGLSKMQDNLVVLEIFETAISVNLKTYFT